MEMAVKLAHKSVPYKLTRASHPRSHLIKGVPMYQAVFFDMDGTILDTITDLTICTNYALSQLESPMHFPQSS